MEVVGWHLGIPASEVYGAATSYTELRIAEPGQRVLQVCTGISCVVNGGAQLLEDAKASLGIDAGQTASDGRWTLEEAPCAFLCGVAPVVRLDDHWHGRATSELIERLIDRGSEAS